MLQRNRRSIKFYERAIQKLKITNNLSYTNYLNPLTFDKDPCFVYFGTGLAYPLT